MARVSFRQRIAGAFKAFRMVWTGSYGSGFYPWGMNVLPGTSRHWERDAGDIWRNSAVFAAIAWIQRNFPDAKFEVVTEDRQGKDVAIPDHDLVNLIKRPNPHYSGTQLWMGTALSYLSDGNAYWLKARNRIADMPGYPVELWWVPHWMMRPDVPADGSSYLKGYIYTVNGRQYPVKTEDVVHFRYGRDPSNDRLGLSPWKATLREIVTDNEMLTYHAAIVSNFGVPGVVASPATPDTMISKEDAEEFKALFKQKFTGDLRGEPLVVPYPVKLDMPGWSPKDLSLETMFHLSEERISAVIGLSPMVLGLGSGLTRSTFTNYGEARRAAYEDCLIPLHRMLADDLNMQLLPDFDDPLTRRACWEYGKVRALMPDPNELVKQWTDLFDAGLARQSEARERVGLQAEDGQDKFNYEIPELAKMKQPQPQQGAAAGAPRNGKGLEV